MHPAIQSMLLPYQCKTANDFKNALKEIFQEIALLGLARQGFFDKAAFYGGTALRIAHRLNRFSEDMDFTLLKADPMYDISSYLKGIEDEFSAFGLRLVAEKKKKSSESAVESAFLKANTLEHLLLVGDLKSPSGVHRDEIIKIKFEIDTNPPDPAGIVETAFQMRPIPFSYKILTLSSLFSGKLHAVLCRKYMSGRVKGRDYYDFIWYVDKAIAPDLPYLEAKLRQSGHWTEKSSLDAATLRQLLNVKFASINWEQAKKDVLPFIKDDFALKVWSADFFKILAEKIQESPVGD